MEDQTLLLGGFTNPSEKIGKLASSSPIFGVKIPTMFELLPPFAYQKRSWNLES